MQNLNNKEQSLLEQRLSGITLQGLAELRSYSNPPPPILRITSILQMILNQQPKTSLWPDCRKMLSNPNLIQQLSHFDMNIKQHPQATAQLKKLCQELDPQKIKNISNAAFYLFQWLITMDQYYSGQLQIEK